MTDRDVAGEHYDMISEIIDRWGLMVQCVGAGADTQAFAYTVGLAKLDHPELIIFGLSHFEVLQFPALQGKCSSLVKLASAVIPQMVQNW